MEHATKCQQNLVYQQNDIATNAVAFYWANVNTAIKGSGGVPPPPPTYRCQSRHFHPPVVGGGAPLLAHAQLVHEPGQPLVHPVPDPVLLAGIQLSTNM